MKLSDAFLTGDNEVIRTALIERSMEFGRRVCAEKGLSSEYARVIAREWLIGAYEAYTGVKLDE